MPFERWLYKLPLRWRSIARRRQVEHELDEEIRFHLERKIEDAVARGVEPAEARRVAMIEFGGVEPVKERCRDTRGLNRVESLVQDVRYGVRTLRRDPVFSVVAIVTLALGIGANTAVFSLVYGILLERLPFPAPDHLVSVTGTYPNGAFAAMRDELRTIDVAAYAEGHLFTVTGVGEPVRLGGTRVSAEFFSILGVTPARGRWFRTGEDVAPQDRVVVLSHALWATRFKRDETIIGRSVVLDGTAREVVGVMPPSFQFPSVRTQLWVPLGLDSRNTVGYWAGDFMPVVGRLRAGATASEARTEVRVFQARVPGYFPWRMPDSWNRDVSVAPLQDVVVGDVKPRLLILLAAVTLMLLTACANVANLSLSRAVTREREIAIRTAIGAAPARIARQLLTESVVLALAGALVGLLFATQLLSLLKLVLPSDTPRLADVHLNWRMLVFAGGLGILTGCVFGLAPALQAVRLRVRSALDAGGRSGGRTPAGPLRASLTIAQIASAVLLVIAAGLLVRSFWALSHGDLGFETDRVSSVRVSPSESLCGDADRCLAFYHALDEGLGAAPGVNGAALINTLPLTGAVAKRALEIEGHTIPAGETAPLFWLNAITPDYFRVMDLRLERGRSFTRQDLSGNPAGAIISAATARRYWPGQDPIGRRVRFVGEPHWHTIVGVVEDALAFDPARDVPAWIAGTIYVPFGPRATLEDGRLPSEMTVVLKTTLEAPRVASTIGRVAGARDDLVIGTVKSMRAVLGEVIAAPAATTSLLGAMAALALALGSVGVYGVVSFLVSKQTRNLAIRRALGAQGSDVLRLVLRDAAVLCVTGIALGLAGAMIVSRWLSSELHGVSATDPTTYVIVAVAVSLVTLGACYVPTRRATRIDPVILLREP